MVLVFKVQQHCSEITAPLGFLVTWKMIETHVGPSGRWMTRGKAACLLRGDMIMVSKGKAQTPGLFKRSELTNAHLLPFVLLVGCVCLFLCVSPEE